jgi:hypothetical protein
MKISRFAIYLVWGFIIMETIVAGYYPPAIRKDGMWANPDIFTIGLVFLAPVVLILMGFRKRYLPMAMNRWVPFLIRLKGELLIGSSAVIVGFVGFVRSTQHDDPREPLMLNAFFVSGGMGMLTSYFIMRKRGLFKASRET